MVDDVMKTLRSIVAILILVACNNEHKSAEIVQKGKCVQNLRRLGRAKQLWAQQEHKTNGDVPTMEDIGKRIVGEMPTCPSGGTYTVGAVGQTVKCSVPGHKLPP